MELSSNDKRVIRAVLSASPSPNDLRAFLELCHDLILPLIRRRFSFGKMHHLQMSESEIIYDCLADLFERDTAGVLVRFQSYFENHGIDVVRLSDTELFFELQRIVFIRVHNNIVRLLAEDDPILDKVLRRLKVAMESTHLFKQERRMGEAYMVPLRTAQLDHLTPIPFEYVRNQFQDTVRIHDNVPTLLRKLYAVLVNQESHQRIVPLVSVALLFKETYALGWETEDRIANDADEKLQIEGLTKVVQGVCDSIRKETWRRYVGEGKHTSDVFENYIFALRTILSETITGDEPESASYFDHLRRKMPDLTKDIYLTEHRSVLEYLARLAKKRLKAELKK